MIRVHPIGAALGAEIEGIDLREPLSDEQLHSLESALVQHQVIFFRDQEITPAQQSAFARRFGAPQCHPAYPHVDGYPELSILESDRENPSKIEKWHTDMTFRPNPPLGSILRARIVPPKGGDTLWLSLAAAYEALSEPMRKFLDGLRAEHSFEHGFQESLAEPGGRERLAQALADNPPVEHPVVRTHPVSGRRCLFVNCLFTTRIVGLHPAESDALLEFLYAHVQRKEFTCRFHWRENSIAFWDNRSTQHRPENDYWPERRRMERVTIEGDEPF
ncbi:MAG: taurine dioxygenase [Deltaproteobacteria bacterium]|nr:taurine dioxygenase [Deltaproteobacteria bacterium]